MLQGDPIVYNSALIAQLKEAQTLFKDIIEGKKPILTDEQAQWVPELALRMSKGQHLSEEPHAYYRIEDEDGKVQETAGVVSISPISSISSKRRSELKRDIDELDFDSIRICGNRHSVKNPEAMERIAKRTEGFIAIEGGFHTAYEMVSILLQKLQRNGTEKDDPFDKPFIIESRKRKGSPWMPLLEAVGILDNLDVLEAKDVFLSVGRKMTKEIAHDLRTSLLGKESIVRDPEEFSDPAIPSGATFVVATNNAQKVKEMKMVFANIGADVKIIGVEEFMGPIKSAHETSASLEGNMYEKLEEAFKKWRGLSSDLQEKHLLKLGLKPENVYFLADDRGTHFLDQRIVEQPEFDKIRGSYVIDDATHHHIFPFKSFPGNEVGPVMDAMGGIDNFYGAVSTIAQRIPDLDFRMIERNVLGLAALNQESGKRLEVMGVSGTETNVAISQPRPLNPEAVYKSDHYQTPVRFNPDGKTMAELDGHNHEHLVNYSALARACLLLVEVCRIKTGQVQNVQQYEGEFVVGVAGAFNLSTQLEIVEALDGENISVRESEKIKVASGIKDGLLNDRDAYLFIANPELNQPLGQITEDLFKVMSLFVGKQIHDPKLDNKPFVVVDPIVEKEGVSKHPAMQILYDLKRQGVIKEDIHDVVKVVSSVKEAATWINEAKTHYTGRMELPEDRSSGDEIAHKKYNVAIFCSASTSNPQLLEDAYSLSWNLADKGFGHVSGGGAKSMMGHINEAVHDFTEGKIRDFSGDEVKRVQKMLRDKDGFAHAAGSHGTEVLPNNNVCCFGVQTQETAQIEGIPPGMDKIGGLILTKDIFDRMEKMVRGADAFVIQAGGAGTMQETALLLMMKANGHPDMKDKPIIVHNRPFKSREIVDGQSQEIERGFYDTLLRQFSKEQLKAMDVSVVAKRKDILKVVEADRAVRLPDKAPANGNGHEGGHSR